MKTLGERFKYLREKRGYSQLDLAHHLGVTQQAVQQVESGKARKPRYLYEAANFLQTSYEWLLFGQDNPLYGQSAMSASDGNVAEPSSVLHTSTQIKIKELAPYNGDFYRLTGDVADMIPRPRQLDGIQKAYGVYIQDARMRPRYDPGDLILFHPGKPVAAGDYVGVIASEGQDTLFVIGHLKAKGAHTYVFNRLNPLESFEINSKDIQRIDKIVGSIQI